MRKREGFTLIELLVVIAIIAILAAILFPVFTESKKRSQTTRCTSNLKQLSNAWILYCQDHEGKSPFVWPKNEVCQFIPGRQDWCGLEPDGSYEMVYPQRSSLWRYTKGSGLFFCSLDKGRPATGFPCAPNKKKEVPLSYSINGSLHSVNLDAMPGGTRTSKMLLFIHEDHATINDGLFAWPTTVDLPDSVHHEGTTLSYCDGHAAWRSKKALILEKNSWIWDPAR